MVHNRFVEPLAKAAVAAVVLICHLALATLIIMGVKGLEWLIHNGTGELLLFDRFPLRYLFHAIDIGIVAVFGWFGLREAIVAFRDEKE
jgi:arginine exporter protein ArgO